MAFVGVEFVDHGGISLVNAAWLTPLKKEVYWPTKQTNKNFLKLLKSGDEDPNNPTNGIVWKLHGVQRIFFQTDDIEGALQKIKKAEETSNIDTEYPDESITLRKRVRKPRIISSSDESDVEIDQTLKRRREQFSRPPPIISSFNRGAEFVGSNKFIL